MSATLPTNKIVTEILTNRVLFITGVGRSGTTILGKLLGSIEPAYYFFEPYLFKYLVPGTSGDCALTIRNLFFEDYIMPVVQGRNLNCRRDEDTYWGNYYRDKPIHPSSRQNSVERLRNERPFFVIKANESQFCLGIAKAMFPGCTIVHIVRNGIDVVGSMMHKGWYTDEFCNTKMTEQSFFKGGVYEPWFNNMGDWGKATPETRAAHVWRILVEEAQRHRVQSLRYEKLSEFNINEDIEWPEDFEIKDYSLYWLHKDSVRSHDPKHYDRASILEKIEPRERELFQNCDEYL